MNEVNILKNLVFLIENFKNKNLSKLFFLIILGSSKYS